MDTTHSRIAPPSPAPPRRAIDPALRRVAVLGSTGSIGTQTLDVIHHLNALHDRGEHPTRYDVVALATGSNADGLRAQASSFPDAITAVAKQTDGVTFTGDDAATRAVTESAPDLVISAIVGIAGLPATLAAVESGADVALANKESLVAAGELVTRTAQRTGARLLPVDSEHAAIWQALQTPERQTVFPPLSASDEVRRVILTASGGAFRDTPSDALRDVTPEQALAHPTWNMGAKITVDCATLINKALELIEARWFFDLASDRLDVLVHRQSIVHSLVEYRDGNLLAQLGTNDMRIAIQHAVTFPGRAPSESALLDLAKLGSLTFEQPDHDRFPGLALAWRVIDEGGNSGAVLNGANEAAVGAFLDGRLRFTGIAEVCARAMDEIPCEPIGSLEDARRADASARDAVARFIAEHAE